MQLSRSSRLLACSSIVLSTLACGVIVSACESDSGGASGGFQLDGAAFDLPDQRAGDAGATDEDAGRDAGPSCETGLVLCGSSCVSTQTDSKHCGACGKACDADEACRAGACKPVCQIDGKTVDEGALDPANPCQQCSPATSTTAWSLRADGTSCGAGLVCESNACVGKCYIDGAFHAAGAANPANICQQCTPATSTTAWTARASADLLVGGPDVAGQGWLTTTQAPAALTYGPDYVRIATSTAAGASTSGQLLLHKGGIVPVGMPFKIQVEMLVEAVNAHNQYDSGAAILGSFTAPFGQGNDRAQMIYLDSAAIGWADDTQSAAVAVTNGAYHTYELSVDAAGAATVSVDGVARLTRAGFTTNGTFAVGDQTNDSGVDGTVRIRSVKRICP